MLYYYLIQGKGWSKPYVLASTLSWPVGTYVLFQAQRCGGMPGENCLVKGVILENITESEADSVLNGHRLTEVICAISENEYYNDDYQLSEREIKARWRKSRRQRDEQPKR